MSVTLLEIDNLSVDYETARGDLKALRNISFDVNKGEIVGIVGESGCGKSTLARAVVGLEDPSAGSISWDGEPIDNKSKDRIKSRHYKVQLVFQDPY